MNKILVIITLTFLFHIQSMAQEAKIDGISYKVVAPGEAEVSFGANAVGDIVIPAIVKIKKQTCKVVGIGEKAFVGYYASHRTKLTGITMSENIRYIEARAFESCENLQTVVLSPNLERIGLSAFRLCFNLQTINIPASLIIINDSAFCYCCSLKHITIPSTVKNIGENAFYECDLQEIEIPNSVDSIGDQCFGGNKNLKKVVLPRHKVKVTKNKFIFHKIFKRCHNIEYVISPYNVMRDFEKHFENDCPFMKKYRTSIQNSFSYYAYNEVSKRLIEWQKKTEFETTDEWRVRVTEQTREKQMTKLMEYMRNEYIKHYSTKISKGNLGTYNADDGIFPVNINGINKDIYVKVPKSEAPNFKQKWNEVTMVPQYGIVDDQIAVLSCSFQLGGKKYVSTQNYTNDCFSDMAIDLPPLEMDFGSVNDNVPSVAQRKPVRKEIEKRDYSIDRNIPETNVSNDKTFAVIIGNEDYQRVTCVDFAKNDAKIFAAYCQKTLGLPERNIRSYSNATYGTMLAALKDIKEIADAYNGDINILFYYAGHGIPDGKGNAYLLPVDADGTQSEVCLSTSRLYQKLNELNAKKLVVLMDACFSGAKRGDGMLMAARGVAIKSVFGIPEGNAIVFSAANGEETAFPYKEKGHGMFTYFLLKKLQETKGDVTLGELADYIKKQVGTLSVVVNRKKQTPTVVPSATAYKWKSLKLK